MNSTEALYYVTVVSNFARGFDKYARTYSKRGIAESTFADRFFLLPEAELGIGVRKAARLLEKVGLAGNRLMALRTSVPSADLKPNTVTGLGRYVSSSEISVQGVYFVEGTAENHRLVPVGVEDSYALSLQLLNPTLPAWDELRPRTVSVLPLARACQAKCAFCFSRASVSADQVQDSIDLERLERICIAARQRGAERLVITGGGEPGLVCPERLTNIIEMGANHFRKVVIITNGQFLAKLGTGAAKQRIFELWNAGLSVLAVSRHHHEAARNAAIMGLDINTELVMREAGAARRTAVAEAGRELRLRLVCVLQRDGVEDEASLAAYLDWAAGMGGDEVCFKELYVSTTRESAYADAAANVWSREHQVPLALVLNFAAKHGFVREGELPWGAPVFGGEWRGRRLRIAAYTEPSVMWERTHGIARSWNVMADNRCLASLEDPASLIDVAAVKPGVAA